MSKSGSRIPSRTTNKNRIVQVVHIRLRRNVTVVHSFSFILHQYYNHYYWRGQCKNGVLALSTIFFPDLNDWLLRRQLARRHRLSCILHFESAGNDHCLERPLLTDRRRLSYHRSPRPTGYLWPLPPHIRQKVSPPESSQMMASVDKYSTSEITACYLIANFAFNLTLIHCTN